MAKTTIYLDKRSQKANGTFPLKLVISHKNKSTMISLNVDILSSQWDSNNSKIINHPQKAYLNNYVFSRKTIADNTIVNLTLTDTLKNLTIAELKKRIINDSSDEDVTANEPNEEFGSFFSHYQKFASEKYKKNTRNLYLQTQRHICNFIGEENAKKLKFEDITKEWLTKFDRFLTLTSPSQNARNVHFRNIRAVINDAIDNELTTSYPFRRFKLKYTQTAKRSLSVEQLREYFNAPCVEHQQQYLDIFKLTFFLIGINIVDLSHLKRIVNGRIEYHRAKTNRLYSIKVEPEAMEIINKYKGDKWLLNVLDRYDDYLNYSHRLNRNLKEIGNTTVGKQGRMIHRPLHPEISIYWARHTWATIAAELDIPKETIAAALGHGGNTVTDIYIRFDDKKIDAANRKVIDYVLYNK